MSRWRIDTSAWPLVIHEVEGTLSDEQYDSYLREATALKEREGTYVAVLDASKVGGVSAYARVRFAEWQRTNREFLNARCLGMAFVIQSPLMRFVNMSILLVTGLAVPYKVCATRQEAQAWAERRLQMRSK
jgi:hypothetical protein